MRQGSESERQAQRGLRFCCRPQPGGWGGGGQGRQGTSGVAQGLAGGDQGKGPCFLGDGEARTGGCGGMGSPRSKTGAW